jgi:hypothetical protein
MLCFYFSLCLKIDPKPEPEVVPTPLNLPEGASEDEVLAAKIGGNHVKAVSFHG